MVLTVARLTENIALTADFYVNQATVPLGVAVFRCPCGVTHVQHGFEQPSGWATAVDGSDRCPHCAGSNTSDGDPAPRAG